MNTCWELSKANGGAVWKTVAASRYLFLFIAEDRCRNRCPARGLREQYGDERCPCFTSGVISQTPSSGADRWRWASMTISDGKNYSQGWAITQSAWCERAKADGESRAPTQRRSIGSSLNRGKEPDTWKLGRETSQAKMAARTKDSRLEEKERRTALPTWALFRVEVWEDAWWVLSMAGSSYMAVCNAVFSVADMAAGTSQPSCFFSVCLSLLPWPLL